MANLILLPNSFSGAVDTVDSLSMCLGPFSTFNIYASAVCLLADLEHNVCSNWRELLCLKRSVKRG